MTTNLRALRSLAGRSHPYFQTRFRPKILLVFTPAFAHIFPTLKIYGLK